MQMSDILPELVSPVQTLKSGVRNYVVYFTFALCSSLYLLPFMRLLLQGTDEGTLIYGAVRVVHGQVFARDFFEVIGPGTFYWLSIFFKIFGVTFVTTRICLFLTSLGTSLLIYFLSRRVCKRCNLLPSILLAGMYFGVLWPAISHHVDSNCFALLSFASIVLWQDRQRDSLVLAAGMMAGVTTCFLQPKGLLLFVAMLLWLWIQLRRRAASISALGLLVGGYCGVVGAVLLYFWSRGALWDLAYANFVWPSQHYGAVNAVPYAQGLIHNYWDRWVIAKNGSTLMVAMAAVMITPFLFVVGLPALLLALGTLQGRDALKPQVVLYGLCGSALWLSEFHRKDIYHLVFGAPLLIILGIYFLVECHSKIADLGLQVLAISAFWLAGFNLFLVLTAHTLTTRAGSVAMFGDDPAQMFVETHIASGEEMFAYPYWAMYYFLSSTTNPTRYSFLMYNYNTPSQFGDVIHVLDHRRIRYVVWNTSFEEKGVLSFFPSTKQMQPNELIIEPYLESHYKIVWQNSGTRIMERKSEDRSNYR
jgi:hypothetical protein